jgi:hypothetical protein
VLRRGTKEREKINLLSHRRVPYISFSQLVPTLNVILVISIHDDEHEQNYNGEVHINEDCTGEQNLVVNGVIKFLF